ncbi:MAG: transporter substrate-binding domain-containing protein [Bacillota bacterium]|nr:transporter substrate-binding domain-containing protein [Bacillota bacterium]
MKKKTLALLCAILVVTSVISFSSCKKAANNQNFVVLNEKLATEQYGVGFRKGDIALGLEVQKQLDSMISDGTAAKISTKWFGSDQMIHNASFLKETSAPVGDDSLKKVKEKGKLILGLDASFPPMGYTDDNNNVVGFDIDLAKEVAKRMGVTLVPKPTDWDTITLSLNSNKIDCIWNGLTINSDRLKAMFFAKPYLNNYQAIMVPEGSSIKSVADLAGKKVGYQKGSSALDAINASSVKSSIAKLSSYPDNVSAFLDLKVGRIDALVLDSVVSKYISDKYKDK